MDVGGDHVGQETRRQHLARRALGIVLDHPGRPHREVAHADAVALRWSDQANRRYVMLATLGLPEELARAELYQGDFRRANRFVQELRAVTPEDIQRAARTYMSKVRWAYVGDPSKVTPARMRGPSITPSSTAILSWASMSWLQPAPA